MEWCARALLVDNVTRQLKEVEAQELPNGFAWILLAVFHPIQFLQLGMKLRVLAREAEGQEKAVIKLWRQFVDRLKYSDGFVSQDEEARLELTRIRSELIRACKGTIEVSRATAPIFRFSSARMKKSAERTLMIATEWLPNLILDDDNAQPGDSTIASSNDLMEVETFLHGLQGIKERAIAENRGVATPG